MCFHKAFLGLELCRPYLCPPPPQPTPPTPPTPIIQTPNVAVSGTSLPPNRDHKSWNGVFRVQNDVFRLHSSSRIEMKFVDFTRVFDQFLVPECGSFGDQVARKPRPRALKRRGQFFSTFDHFRSFWPFRVKSDQLVGWRSRSARDPAAELHYGFRLWDPRSTQVPEWGRARAGVGGVLAG